MALALALTLAGAGTLAAAAARADALFGPPARQGPLTADQAFRVLPPQRNGDRLRVEWDIAPGYFLYRPRIEVLAAAPAGRRLSALALPAGLPYHDAHFGDTQIYRNDLVATATGAAGVQRVRVRYQGCADIGICYPPQDKELAVSSGDAP